MKLLALLCLLPLALAQNLTISHPGITPRGLPAQGPVFAPRDIEPRTVSRLGCWASRTIGAGSMFEIASPNFPSPYGPNAARSSRCLWNFRIMPNIALLITCRDFSLSRTTRSCTDNLSFWWRGIWPQRTCGTTLRGAEITGFPVRTTSSYNLIISFFMMQGSRGAGFRCTVLGENLNTGTDDSNGEEETTQGQTEAPTEPTTTENTSETTSEALTEPSTDETTGGGTTQATESTTEPTTTASTEPVTETPTEPTTEPATESTTEAPTSGGCPCGVRPESDRIVNGQDADLNEYPWQVNLKYYNSATRQISVGSFCGGTLIRSCYVLTAAHCIPESDGLKSLMHVTVNDHNHVNLGSRETLVKVEKIIVHPGYKSIPAPINDFALLKLSHCQEFSKGIAPACLPEEDSGDFAGNNATVTGWGKLASGGSQPEILQEAELKVLTNEQCSNSYAAVAPITKEMICARGEGKDSCQGDSGGPLTTNVGGKATLIGVVSFGIGCADPRFPGVYARTSTALAWIKQHVGDKC